MTRTRRVVKIIGPWRVSVSLVCGVVLTVFVAWWFQTGYRRYDFPNLPYTEREVYGAETFETCTIYWVTLERSAAHTEGSIAVFTAEQVKYRVRWYPRPDDTVPVPGVMRKSMFDVIGVVARGEDYGSDGGERASITAVGYPMRAFCCWSFADAVYDQTNLMVKRGSVSITNPFNNSPVDLAYVPIWPGFLGNSAIYTGLAYMLLAVPWAITGLRRRLTNRCHPCGYRLDGLTADTCPECGWVIKRRAARPREDGDA